jgi:uncharacterized protein involved in response to NO
MQPVPLPIFKAREPSTALTGLPLLRLGFRPFYLCGAMLATLGVPLWIAMFLGWIALAPSLAPLLWHVHEMIFGFAVSIIVGFLMTAGKAWTGLATPRGPALGALALLWLGARVVAFTGPYPLYAALDLALLPIVAVILTRLLLRSGNHRNLPLAGLLGLLSCANLVFHLSVMGVLQLPALTPLHAALALIVMIECVMAGRVIPAFTMSVTPGLKLAAPVWLERLTLGSTGLGLGLWVFAAPGLLSGAVLALAGALQLQRVLSWRPWVARQRPILWILHAAYAWIPLALGLLAAAQAGWVPVSAGVHALGLGATGGLIIGMITRTARGHTGRTLQSSRVEVLAYALVMGAAALRVLLPMLVPSMYVAALLAAALAWSGAFAIYLWRFTPWLMQTRLDGKDG